MEEWLYSHTVIKRDSLVWFTWSGVGLSGEPLATQSKKPEASEWENQWFSPSPRRKVFETPWRLIQRLKKLEADVHGDGSKKNASTQEESSLPTLVDFLLFFSPPGPHPIGWCRPPTFRSGLPCQLAHPHSTAPWNTLKDTLAKVCLSNFLGVS
jgi:hypothetical protein